MEVVQPFAIVLPSATSGTAGVRWTSLDSTKHALRMTELVVSGSNLLACPSKPRRGRRSRSKSRRNRSIAASIAVFPTGFPCFLQDRLSLTLPFEGEESQGTEDDPWYGAQTTDSPKIADIVQVMQLLLHAKRLEYKLLTGRQHCAWHGSWIKGHSDPFCNFSGFWGLPHSVVGERVHHLVHPSSIPCTFVS